MTTASTTTRPYLRVQMGPFGHPAYEAEALYQATSSLPLLQYLDAPDELADYLEALYAAAPPGTAPRDVVLERTGPAGPWDRPYHSPYTWVAYTGGKDSVAAALKVEATGGMPRLYHVAGLNRGMGDELRYAQRLARHRGWPLLVDRVVVSGKKEGLVELPTKNQVTALLLAGRMAERGGTTYTAGWHTADHQHQQEFGYDYSDGTEAIDRFHRYLAARYPGLTYRPLLRDVLDAWATCAAAGLLQYVKGCVTAPRRKAQVRDANVAKFGPLLAGRCGACVKCAWEQLALERLGILEHHPARRAHGTRFLLRDFGPRLGTTDLEEVEEHLVPAARAAQLARTDWPAQPAPADEQDGTPTEWRTA